MLNRVARHYRVPKQQLQARGGYGLEARNVAIWLVWEKCGMSLREIGELFGGIHYMAIAQRLRRIKPSSSKVAMKLLSKM